MTVATESMSFVRREVMSPEWKSCSLKRCFEKYLPKRSSRSALDLRVTVTVVM